MSVMDHVWRWLVTEYQWPYAALFGGLCLLAAAPCLAMFAPVWVLLVYLQLPIYMVHQVEEHGGDRFRVRLNQDLANGLDALTRGAAFWINSALVWGPLLFALYAGLWLAPVWSLLGSYLLVINALVHILSGIFTRRYNPGLITAVLLLLPLGLLTIRYTALPLRAYAAAHLATAFLIVLLHAGIILHVLRRKRLLMARAG